MPRFISVKHRSQHWFVADTASMGWSQIFWGCCCTAEAPNGEGVSSQIGLAQHLGKPSCSRKCEGW
jgi:hypothetical protein